MTEKEFLPPEYPIELEEGRVSYRSPSNIALVKYWGKKEGQIPANPSISFTLDTCATETTVFFRKRDTDGETNTKSPDASRRSVTSALTSKSSRQSDSSSSSSDTYSFELLFEGQPKESFKPKIQTFFRRMEKYLPFIRDYHFTIETSNSFPHSSGIASSASGMSALALCLMAIERKLRPDMGDDLFNKKASFLSRLGSGSACRSIEGELVQWGRHADIEGSSDLYGIPYPYEIHQIFKNFQDTILLVDQGQKQVSSSGGHDLMHGHPFAEQRFGQARKNLSDLRSVLANGDLPEFIKIVESEALTLHAMMMTGNPYFILMKPNTLEIIQKIWDFRKSSDANLCFTLDAGANVHVLYPKAEKETVNRFIQDELVRFCENGKYIDDRSGAGASELKTS